jgi:hypothetical protein
MLASLLAANCSEMQEEEGQEEEGQDSAAGDHSRQRTGSSHARFSFIILSFALVALAFHHRRAKAGRIHIRDSAPSELQDYSLGSSAQGVHSLAVLPGFPSEPQFLPESTEVMRKGETGSQRDRGVEIGQCVTNLNLANLKLLQVGAVIAEATQNCPQGFTNTVRKEACMINIAAVVAASSAAASFYASTAILCPGSVKPDAACASVLAALFETFATFPAASGQISLFCPKNAAEETAPSGLEVFEADRRLASSNKQALQAFQADRRLTPLSVPGDELEIVFCTWQISQTLFFFARAGLLIQTATNLCPPNKGDGKSVADCSEVINEILTQMLNAVKFIAAAITNCVKETDVRAGCALGSLNFLSALTQAGSVASALAGGVCFDLDEKKKEKVKEDIERIKKIKRNTVRRLWMEKKLIGAANNDKVDFEADLDNLNSNASDPNATVEDLLRGAGVNLKSSSWPPAACVADLQELQKLQPEVDKANWTSIEATYREWEAKYQPATET